MRTPGRTRRTGRSPPAERRETPRREHLLLFRQLRPDQVVNNRLEWGAEQTCENPSDRPHWIVVKLEETCPQSWCIVFNTDAEVRSPAWEELTRVVRVAEADTCVDNDQRKIRVVVNAFARGGAGTATAISGEVLLDCDVD